MHKMNRQYMTDLPNIENRKLNLISAIAISDDLEKIAVIESLLFNNQHININSVSDFEKEKIEEALRDVQAGKFVSHDSVMSAVTNRIYAK